MFGVTVRVLGESQTGLGTLGNKSSNSLKSSSNRSSSIDKPSSNRILKVDSKRSKSSLSQESKCLKCKTFCSHSSRSVTSLHASSSASSASSSTTIHKRTYVTRERRIMRHGFDAPTPIMPPLKPPRAYPDPKKEHEQIVQDVQTILKSQLPLNTLRALGEQQLSGAALRIWNRRVSDLELDVHKSALEAARDFKRPILPDLEEVHDFPDWITAFETLLNAAVAFQTEEKNYALPADITFQKFTERLERFTKPQKEEVKALEEAIATEFETRPDVILAKKLAADVDNAANSSFEQLLHSPSELFFSEYERNVWLNGPFADIADPAEQEKLAAYCQAIENGTEEQFLAEEINQKSQLINKVIEERRALLNKYNNFVSMIETATVRDYLIRKHNAERAAEIVQVEELLKQAHSKMYAKPDAGKQQKDEVFDDLEDAEDAEDMAEEDFDADEPEVPVLPKIFNQPHVEFTLENMPLKASQKAKIRYLEEQVEKLRSSLQQTENGDLQSKMPKEDYAKLVSFFSALKDKPHVAGKIPTKELRTHFNLLFPISQTSGEPLSENSVQLGFEDYHLIEELIKIETALKLPQGSIVSEDLRSLLLTEKGDLSTIDPVDLKLLSKLDSETALNVLVQTRAGIQRSFKRGQKEFEQFLEDEELLDEDIPRLEDFDEAADAEFTSAELIEHNEITPELETLILQRRVVFDDLMEEHAQSRELLKNLQSFARELHDENPLWFKRTPRSLNELLEVYETEKELVELGLADDLPASDPSKFKSLSDEWKVKSLQHAVELSGIFGSKTQVDIDGLDIKTGTDNIMFIGEVQAKRLASLITKQEADKPIITKSKNALLVDQSVLDEINCGYPLGIDPANPASITSGFRSAIHSPDRKPLVSEYLSNPAFRRLTLRLQKKLEEAREKGITSQAAEKQTELIAGFPTSAVGKPILDSTEVQSTEDIIKNSPFSSSVMTDEYRQELLRLIPDEKDDIEKLYQLTNRQDPIDAVERNIKGPLEEDLASADLMMKMKSLHAPYWRALSADEKQQLLTTQSVFHQAGAITSESVPATSLTTFSTLKTREQEKLRQKNRKKSDNEADQENDGLPDGAYMQDDDEPSRVLSIPTDLLEMEQHGPVSTALVQMVNSIATGKWALEDPRMQRILKELPSTQFDRLLKMSEEVQNYYESAQYRKHELLTMMETIKEFNEEEKKIDFQIEVTKELLDSALRKALKDKISTRHKELIEKLSSEELNASEMEELDELTVELIEKQKVAFESMSEEEKALSTRLVQLVKNVNDYSKDIVLPIEERVLEAMERETAAIEGAEDLHSTPLNPFRDYVITTVLRGGNQDTRELFATYEPEIYQDEDEMESIYESTQSLLESLPDHIFDALVDQQLLALKNSDPLFNPKGLPLAEAIPFDGNFTESFERLFQQAMSKLALRTEAHELQMQKTQLATAEEMAEYQKKVEEAALRKYEEYKASVVETAETSEVDLATPSISQIGYLGEKIENIVADEEDFALDALPNEPVNSSRHLLKSLQGNYSASCALAKASKDDLIDAAVYAEDPVPQAPLATEDPHYGFELSEFKKEITTLDEQIKHEAPIDLTKPPKIHPLFEIDLSDPVSIAKYVATLPDELYSKDGGLLRAVLQDQADDPEVTTAYLRHPVNPAKLQLNFIDKTREFKENAAAMMPEAIDAQFNEIALSMDPQYKPNSDLDKIARELLLAKLADPTEFKSALTQIRQMSIESLLELSRELLEVYNHPKSAPITRSLLSDVLALMQNPILYGNTNEAILKTTKLREVVPVPSPVSPAMQTLFDSLNDPNSLSTKFIHYIMNGGDKPKHFDLVANISAEQMQRMRRYVVENDIDALEAELAKTGILDSPEAKERQRSLKELQVKMQEQDRQMQETVEMAISILREVPIPKFVAGDRIAVHESHLYSDHELLNVMEGGRDHPEKAGYSTDGKLLWTKSLENASSKRYFIDPSTGLEYTIDLEMKRAYEDYMRTPEDEIEESLESIGGLEGLVADTSFAELEEVTRAMGFSRQDLVDQEKYEKLHLWEDDLQGINLFPLERPHPLPGRTNADTALHAEYQEATILAGEPDLAPATTYEARQAARNNGLDGGASLDAAFDGILHDGEVDPLPSLGEHWQLSEPNDPAIHHWTQFTAFGDGALCLKIDPSTFEYDGITYNVERVCVIHPQAGKLFLSEKTLSKMPIANFEDYSEEKSFAQAHQEFMPSTTHQKLLNKFDEKMADPNKPFPVPEGFTDSLDMLEMTEGTVAADPHGLSMRPLQPLIRQRVFDIPPNLLMSLKKVRWPSTQDLKTQQERGWVPDPDDAIDTETADGVDYTATDPDEHIDILSRRKHRAEAKLAQMLKAQANYNSQLL